MVGRALNPTFNSNEQDAWMWAPVQGWVTGLTIVIYQWCPPLRYMPAAGTSASRKYRSPVVSHATPWDSLLGLPQAVMPGQRDLPGLQRPSFMGERTILCSVLHDSDLRHWYQQNATSSVLLGEREQLAQDLVNALATSSQDTGRCTSFRLRLLFTQYC